MGSHYFRMSLICWTLCSIATSAHASDGADGFYRKRASWAASMAATREAIVDAVAKNVEFDGKAVVQQLCRRFWEDFPETDWFLQDSLRRQPKGTELDLVRDFGWYFERERTSAGERALVETAIEEIEAPPAPSIKAANDVLRQSPAPGDAAWLNAYVQVCRLRRAARLRPLVARVQRFVFTKHYTLGGSHYAYTEGLSDAQAERHFVPGTALCLAHWDGANWQIETLLADPHGVIRDPDVSYDGQRILFSWKKSDRDDDYHLYELDLATRVVRQITHGRGVADYEPAYLPDGDIIFNSTRCIQTVDCWWTEVSNLYRWDRQSGVIRRLCFDQVHDNFPTVTDDGRVLYTRWEYNDRGQIYPQPLFQMNPDGTNQREFYGANSWFPTTILHARNVPGTTKLVAVASGHHSRQTGKLILIDPRRGNQEATGVRLVAPPRMTTAEKIDAYGQRGELFQYPYPISATEFLVTYHPVGWKWNTPYGPQFGIYFMTLDGRRELLVRDSQLPCSQPIPVRLRPSPRMRASAVDDEKAGATCYVQDVYDGAGLAGVARGTIKTLRVVALDFRAAGIGSTRRNGPAGGALASTPISVGNGAWDPKIILGDATVHDDGSALFRVPARVPIYFQALDANGQMVQTMRSWTTLQPNETASCVGCHEDKHKTPQLRGHLTEALRAGVETLRPFYGPPRGFSFRREIEPILQTHCVRCHDGTEDSFDLTNREVVDATAKRRWTQAYLTLTHAQPRGKRSEGLWTGDPDHPSVNWISAQSIPPMLPPYSAGSNRSELIVLLERGHEGVRLPAEAIEKLSAWIDLGVPFCGDYREAHAWSSSEIATYQRFLEKRHRLASDE